MNYKTKFYKTHLNCIQYIQFDLKSLLIKAYKHLHTYIYQFKELSYIHTHTHLIVIVVFKNIRS